MVEEKISKYDLKHPSDMAFYHVAFQPKYPNVTYIRECITVRPPSTTELGDEHQVSNMYTNDYVGTRGAPSCVETLREIAKTAKSKLVHFFRFCSFRARWRRRNE